MSKCKVTVFMAVHNGENYIRQAIESVLQQTFKDFELLVIDDGSSDNSVSIIKQYSDSRIRLLRNENNLGLFLTRNRGVDEAKGEYFATLDCDDIASKNRLEIQVKFFNENKEAALCGGRIKYIDRNSNYTGRFSSIKGDQDFFKTLMLFNNIFCNSTTMINTAVLRSLKYRAGYEPAEDYDLFERIVSDYKVGFLNKFLCYYRVHNNNVSTIKSTVRKMAEQVIVERQLKRYGFTYSERDLNIHLKYTTAEFDFENYDLNQYANWLNNLLQQNRNNKVFNERSFELALARQWLRLCFQKFKIKHTIDAFFKKAVVKERYLVTTLFNSL